MYLRKHLETFGEISLTLNRLLTECGYSTKSHNQSIYKDFRTIIKNEIVSKGFGKIDEDVMKIPPSAIFTISLSRDKPIFFSKDNFVLLTIDEYEKISSSTSSLNKSILVGVYLFIKQYIPEDSYITSDCSKISYPSKQQIKSGVGVSSVSTIENAINTLSEMGMIYIRGDMFIEDSEEEGVYIPTRNVYALKKSNLTDDSCLFELERIYKRTVYKKDNVPGTIKFLEAKG